MSFTVMTVIQQPLHLLISGVSGVSSLGVFHSPSLPCLSLSLSFSIFVFFLPPSSSPSLFLSPLPHSHIPCLTLILPLPLSLSSVCHCIQNCNNRPHSTLNLIIPSIYRSQYKTISLNNFELYIKKNQ